jgi:hypothetical protein
MKSQSKISEFEYIGFSSFWGIALISIQQTLNKISPPPSDMFQNPLVTGFVLSLLGMAGAVVVAQMCKLLLWIHKHDWRKILESFSRK